MHDNWLAQRTRLIEVSGIRKAFDLAGSLTDPINLSIGQPDFPVPAAAKEAAKAAIDRDLSGYTITQGIAPLRDRLLADVRARHPGNDDRAVIVTSGSSGGLSLALLCTIDPGDEVILFDPYFVMYPHFVTLAGGTPVIVETYPDFRIDLDKVRAALTPRTKAILVNSPGNPTGVLLDRATLRGLAELARAHDLLLFSDEVYRAFCYDEPYTSPLEFNADTVVFDGFSKAYGMTGWRLGYCHGPRRLIEEMTKLQQFTFVCAPSMVQHAGLAALEADQTPIVAAYKAKRDRLVAALQGLYELVTPGGAFYLFPRVPWGTGAEFVAEAVKNNLLVIPGATFSRRDTHFRISYAVNDAMLERGIDVLRRLARHP